MAAKSINKINNFNPFGLIKRLYMDNSPDRIVTSTSKQLNKLSQNVEGAYSNFLRNTSATIIKEENDRQYKIHARRRLENELAAEQVRKSNEILKEHYFQKRKMQKTVNKIVIENEPTLSKKLKEIMSQDAANSVTKISSTAANFKRFLDFENKPNLIDYKPQASGYVNRWHMKIPSPRMKEYEDRNFMNHSEMIKRNCRADKIVKPPDSKPPTYTSSNEIKKESRLHRAKTQIQNMWQFGSRKIPRLS